MQSELNRTENPNLPSPAAESQGEVTLTGPAHDYEESSASRKKKKMSLKVNLELHKELAKDLVHMRTFYTREYNHKRLGMKLSETTMDKSMERIQGTAKLLVGATYMPRTCTRMYTRALRDNCHCNITECRPPPSVACPHLMLHILSVFLGYIEGRGKTPLLTDLANCELLEQFFTHKKVFITVTVVQMFLYRYLYANLLCYVDTVFSDQITPFIYILHCRKAEPNQAPSLPMAKVYFTE